MMVPWPPLHPRQRGVALLLVLWACALLAVLLGGFAAMARTEGTQARYLFARTQAHYAAEAGIQRAVAALQDPGSSWRADGRAYHLRFNGTDITVRVTSEDGKVDINSARPEVLENLLEAAGQNPADAHQTAQAIVDWRGDATADVSLVNNNAGPAGVGYSPRHGPFPSVSELQLVQGVSAPLYRRLAPYITIWSGRGVPNAAYAPAEVVAALPGIDTQAATDYVKTRRHTSRGSDLPDLPNGMGVFGGGGGATHSIVSTAKRSDGTEARVTATLRKRRNRANGKPYVTLQWREGQVR